MTRTFNWGIIGPGKIARKFARDLSLLPNANLVAVASRSKERSRTFAQEFGVKNVYGSYEELATDPTVDIVYIASLHTCHYRDSLLCLANGKHVLCEKPVAMNSAQFERMTAAAAAGNLFFMEALWTRFLPSFIKCLELYHSGTIGNLRLINADFCINPPYSSESRLFNPRMGGGSLLDIGIYPVFLALEFAGMPLDIKTTAIVTDDHIDTLCAITLLHNNNILAQISSASTANGRIEALLQGSSGMLRLNRCWHAPTTLDLITDGNEPVHFTFDTPGSGYQYEAKEVMRCCEAGIQCSPLWTWEQSRQLIATLDTIREQAGIRYPDEFECTD